MFLDTFAVAAAVGSTVAIAPVDVRHVSNDLRAKFVVTWSPPSNRWR